MADEGLLQLAAGMVNSPEAFLAAAPHLLAHPPQVCHKAVQCPVQARHAQQGILVGFTDYLTRGTVHQADAVGLASQMQSE